MNEAQELLDEGMRLQEGLIGDPTVTYRGLIFPCLVSTMLRGTSLEVGGKVEDVQLTIYIRKSAMPTRTADQPEVPTADEDLPTADEDRIPPHPGKVVHVNNKDYIVLQVDEDSARAAWKCHLGSIHK